MLYKYCTTEGFDILLQSRLRATAIEKFNDPFELIFGVDEWAALEIISREFEEDSALAEVWNHILDEERIQFDKNSIEDLVEKVTLFQIRDFGKVAKEIKQHWNKNMGIICLSESADIIQMWAHYTDNHEGIVIGLDENYLVKDKMALVKVCYRDEMVLLPVTASPDKIEQYEKYFDEVIRRKENNWKYEKEVRLYANFDDKDTDGNYYVNIPPSSITEIYLGLRSYETTEIIAKSIKQRKEYNHLRIYTRWTGTQVPSNYYRENYD